MATDAKRPIDTVLIAADTSASKDLIGRGLSDDFKPVVLADWSLSNLRREVHYYAPNLVILAAERADTALMSTLEAVLEETPVPLILFVGSDPDNYAVQAVRIGISAFVVDGLEASRIEALTKIAMERFSLTDALQSELQKSRDELVSRKLVDQAKGLLMQSKNMSEQEAYGTIRSMAMRQSKPIKDVAQSIIALSDLLP